MRVVDTLRQFVSNNRIVTTMGLGSAFFVLAEPTLISIALGFPFLLIGESIRVISSGFIQKNSRLAQEGPYSFTRNPLYFGSFIMGLGFVIMASQWYLFVLYFLTFYFIYDSTIGAEEQYLAKKFGSTFEEYQKKVPRFFPNVTGVGSWEGSFSWDLVKKHREWNTCLGIFLVVILVFFKMMIGPLI